MTDKVTTAAKSLWKLEDTLKGALVDVSNAHSALIDNAAEMGATTSELCTGSEYLAAITASIAEAMALTTPLHNHALGVAKRLGQDTQAVARSGDRDKDNP